MLADSRGAPSRPLFRSVRVYHLDLAVGAVRLQLGWSDLINVELSPKRYLRGPRSLEVVVVVVHCHHQNDFCIETGSDESRFNVLLIVRDKVARQCLH